MNGPYPKTMCQTLDSGSSATGVQSCNISMLRTFRFSTELATAHHNGRYCDDKSVTFFLVSRALANLSSPCAASCRF